MQPTFIQYVVYSWVMRCALCAIHVFPLCHVSIIFRHFNPLDSVCCTFYCQKFMSSFGTTAEYFIKDSTCVQVSLIHFRFKLILQVSKLQSSRIRIKPLYFNSFLRLFLRLLDETTTSRLIKERKFVRDIFLYIVFQKHKLLIVKNK